MEQQRSAESEKAAASSEPRTEQAPAGAGEQEGQPASQSAASTTAAAPTPAAPTGTPATSTAAPVAEKISIDDFLKVEMRVGQIKVAEKVKGADKLLRMEVDIGSEVRQVVAGIAKAYDPEKLIGRKVVIVVNLQPRKLRGLESNGMIVAASFGEEGLPVLASFLEDVPVGAKLK